MERGAYCVCSGNKGGTSRALNAIHLSTFCLGISHSTNLFTHMHSDHHGFKYRLLQWTFEVMVAARSSAARNFVCASIQRGRHVSLNVPGVCRHFYTGKKNVNHSS
jgi:hypothetical protein